MTAKFDTRLRSRAAILDYILQFCVTYGREKADRERGDYRTAGICGFVHEWADNKAKIGDLVRLGSAPQSKWRLGWLRDTRETAPGWPEYLIESLDDGELCWWGNVGISWLERDSLQPSWEWTDRQWAFNDRWNRVCFKEKDAYIVLPLQPDFGDGHSVTLGTRTRHGFDPVLPKRAFPDWRKVTKSMMAACYDECVAEREARVAEIKAEREAVSGGDT